MQLWSVCWQGTVGRTKNIPRMFTALDVSQFSGWLSAEPCRVKRGGVGRWVACGAGRRSSKRSRNHRAGGCGAAVAQAERRVDPTAERTQNVPSMVRTLDVSQFSGWLNANAFCRVEREVWEEGEHAGWATGAGVGLRRPLLPLTAAHAVSRVGGPSCGVCCEGTRGAHLKHLHHGCDTGRVPA